MRVVLVTVLLAACAGPPKPMQAPPAASPSQQAPSAAPIATAEDPCQGGQIVGDNAGQRQATGGSEAPPEVSGMQGGGTRIQWGESTVSSGLSSSAVRHVVKGDAEALARCAAGATGKMLLEITIRGDDGKVVSAAAHGVSTAVERCLVGELMTLAFPPPTAGANVRVTYALVFAPAAP